MLSKIEQINLQLSKTGAAIYYRCLQRSIAAQLLSYLNKYQLLPSVQSGFRPGHSTETAVLKVLSDILAAVDRGDIAVLVLLDLSAAFDTVDHEILLERMCQTFGIVDQAHSWFGSYLSGRTQSVRRGDVTSSSAAIDCGVPQGSVLGPILFLLYTADLQRIIQRHQLTPHLYADDTQIYGSCRPTDADQLTARVASCVDDVSRWMSANRLQLNVAKTELLWCSNSRGVNRLPVSPMSLGGHIVDASSSVRDLGIYLDADLSMRRHIDVVVSRCYSVLRQLRSIRQYVSLPVFQTLVTTLLLSRLDYGNAVLYGLPAVQLRRLQSVQNAAARLIFGLKRSDHLTDALICLHWLRVPERIQFKLAVLTFRALHGSAPPYLQLFSPLSSSSERRGLRSADSRRLAVPRTQLSTIGDRAFPVAGAKIWNCLPDYVISSPSLSIFRARLKTHLFGFSYPDIAF